MIILGDSREILRAWPGGSVDHIITDPPYPASVQDRLSTNPGLNAKGRSAKSVAAGFDALTPDLLGEIVEWCGIARRWSLIFCALESLGDYARSSEGSRWIRSGTYLKQRALPQLTGDRPGSRVEGIAIRHGLAERLRWNRGGRSGTFVAAPEHRKNTGHPTAKPIALMLQIVEAFTDPGDVILDPFAGSGTTAVACEMLGRKCIAIERDPAYVAQYPTRRASILARAAYHIESARRFDGARIITGDTTNADDHD